MNQAHGCFFVFFWLWCIKFSNSSRESASRCDGSTSFGVSKVMYFNLHFITVPIWDSTIWNTTCFKSSSKPTWMWKASWAFFCTWHHCVYWHQLCQLMQSTLFTASFLWINFVSTVVKSADVLSHKFGGTGKLSLCGCGCLCLLQCRNLSSDASSSKVKFRQLDTCWHLSCFLY